MPSSSSSPVQLPPTVDAERVQYSPYVDQGTHSTKEVPVVKTQLRTVTYEDPQRDDPLMAEMLVSAQSHSSRSQTIETTTVGCPQLPLLSSLFIISLCSSLFPPQHFFGSLFVFVILF